MSPEPTTTGPGRTDPAAEQAVTYADQLRRMYPRLDPVVEDLYLLEAHQIADLPTRAPRPELAAVLHAHPGLVRFFAARDPTIKDFLARLMDEHPPVEADRVAANEQALVWEIADWIVYQRDPDVYDSGEQVDWDLAAVTELIPVAGKVVVDAGAGTGRVTFSAAPEAGAVFAVEPVATLRRYMRNKARNLGMDNVFVLDGFLHAIPLPANSADVLLTCQAIGWKLDDEVDEIERVVRPGGFAMHLLGAPGATRFDSALHQPLLGRGYQPDAYLESGHQIARYWKRIGQR